MAGDWIKFRPELSTHPKFLAMCESLIYDEEHYGMLIYTCGPDALELGVMPPSNKSVTERALRCVTEVALRDVTMGALLRVWSAVNSHCKVEGVDAICCPMTIFAIDEIAGFTGFGDAMVDVGWVIDKQPNTMVFPNFLEFNEPACLRRAMSNAERQRKYRSTHNGGVTPRNGCNGREEKRREEKILEPPNSPLAGDRIDWAEQKRIWNEDIAPILKAKPIKKLDALKDKLRQRLTQNPNFWAEVKEEAKFVHPSFHGIYWLTFDFVISKERSEKFLNGKYRNAHESFQAKPKDTYKAPETKPVDKDELQKEISKAFFNG